MTKSADRLEAEVADLRATIELRDEQLKQARQERADALQLVYQMKEHVQESSELIDQWIYTFDMRQDDNGTWRFDPDQSEIWDLFSEMLGEHQKLIREWNRFSREYNAIVAPREQGRPLAASEAQVKDVRKRRKEGASLRGIASGTGLSVRTVRTIVEKEHGTDRTSKRTNEFRRREFDRLRAADYRARKKSRDALPKKINEAQKRGEQLVKAIKGLGSE